MNTSQQTEKLIESLVAAQSLLKNAVLNKENPHFKSKYADLSSIRDAYIKPLTDNGLCIIQSPSFVDGRVELQTTLAHTSGQWIVNTLSIKPASDSPQAIGSAITYARRYAICAILGIIGDEDDDANLAESKPSNSAHYQERKQFVKSSRTVEKSPEPAAPRKVVFDKNSPAFIAKLASVLKEHNLSGHEQWFAEKLEGAEIKAGLMQSLISEKQSIMLKQDDVPF